MAALLIPMNPLNERSIDDSFARDNAAAGGLEVRTLLLDHDRLEGTEREVSIRGLATADARILYRGWMMSASAYAALDTAVVAAGSALITTPGQYVSAHHLPGWVTIFEGLTPRTTFVPVDASPDAIMEAATALGGTRFVVKDWVKSRKHEWDTAAYAPSIDTLPAIVAEFIRLQDEFLVGDVSIRTFVDLDKSQPEVRVWWTHGAVALMTPHPDFSGCALPRMSADFLEQVGDAVAQLGSPFVTTDLAATAGGEWIVVEVGDGQVSGLPDSATSDDVQTILRAVLGI